jgi:ketol-acid reductoisomerase
MSKLYFDEDANLAVLEGQTIAILGYGNQGRSQALNMHDSGLTVIVGSRADNSGEQAKADGFRVLSYAEAAKEAQIIFVLLPDEVQPEIYAALEPNLKDGATLVFAHGYNIFYGFIKPRTDLDVIMLAPRMIGHGVRTTYLEGQGFPPEPDCC